MSVDRPTELGVGAVPDGWLQSDRAVERYGAGQTVVFASDRYRRSRYRQCIDAATRKIEKQFKFKFGDWPSEVQLNGTRDTIYFINKAVWRLPVTADKFPVKPFLPYNNTLYYGLTINPVNSEVYIADAIDYVQNGVVLRYSPDGELLDEFYVGIIPGAFCWR